jgi:L-ribulose-5-phosphate 3-epimerase
MLLGYNTNGFAHHRLIPALYALNPFDADIADQCIRVSQFLRQVELRCVIETGARFLLDPVRKHQPTLLSNDPHERERRFEFLRRAIEIAQRTDADAVSFWAGTAMDGTSDDECFVRLVDGCKRLCDEAERRGVRLAFEPEPGMFIDTMPKYAELRRRVDHPRFGLTLDVGHVHCMGETPIAPHIHANKVVLWNIHIEDMRRGVHDHLMFGDGDMEFPPIFQALREINYQGGVHVELSRHSHDAVNTAKRAMAFLQTKCAT